MPGDTAAPINWRLSDDWADALESPHSMCGLEAREELECDMTADVDSE